MLETIIARYGLFAVFAGAALEGETAALIGGLLAHESLLPPAGVAAAATAGFYETG